LEPSLGLLCLYAGDVCVRRLGVYGSRICSASSFGRKCFIWTRDRRAANYHDGTASRPVIWRTGPKRAHGDVAFDHDDFLRTWLQSLPNLDGRICNPLTRYNSPRQLLHARCRYHELRAGDRSGKFTSSSTHQDFLFCSTRLRATAHSNVCPVCLSCLVRCRCSQEDRRILRASAMALNCQIRGFDLLHAKHF